MGVATITQMSNRVAALLEERLGARGRDLPEKLAQVNRRLPRPVRRAAEALAAAGEMAKNPKLQIRVDEAQVAEAYDICLRHLAPMGRRGRSGGFLASFGASAAFSVLLVAAGLIGFMLWKGLL